MLPVVNDAVQVYRYDTVLTQV